MALTTAQIRYMQSDLGITNDQSVFTDAELNDLFDRAGDYNTAVFFGVRTIMMSAAKMYSYTEGNTKVDKSKVFDNLKAMYDLWADASRTAANQVAVTSITPVPPNWKDYPVTELSVRRRNLPRRLMR